MLAFGFITEVTGGFVAGGLLVDGLLFAVFSFGFVNLLARALAAMAAPEVNATLPATSATLLMVDFFAGVAGAEDTELVGGAMTEVRGAELEPVPELVPEPVLEALLDEFVETEAGRPLLATVGAGVLSTTVGAITLVSLRLGVRYNEFLFACKFAMSAIFCFQSRRRCRRRDYRLEWPNRL